MDDVPQAPAPNDLTELTVCAALAPTTEHAHEVECAQCHRSGLFVEAGETRVPLCERCWMLRVAATRGFHLGL